MTTSYDFTGVSPCPAHQIPDNLSEIWAGGSAHVPGEAEYTATAVYTLDSATPAQVACGLTPQASIFSSAKWDNNRTKLRVEGERGHDIQGMGAPHPALRAWLWKRPWAGAERGLAALGRGRRGRTQDGLEGAGETAGPGCALRPERSELMLSCHQTFQSPAWEPEEKIREPNTYCFFCSRCQVWWDELAICSLSYDLAMRKPQPPQLPLSVSC